MGESDGKGLRMGVCLSFRLPKGPITSAAFSPPGERGTGPTAPTRLGRIEHPCMADAKDIPKGYLGKGC